MGDPLFVVRGYDKPGAGPARQAARAAHLAHLEAIGSVRLAGPVLDDAGAPIGSLLIYVAPDRATLDRWIAEDPYTAAGVFERVEVAPFRWVIGAPADLT